MTTQGVIDPVASSTLSGNSDFEATGDLLLSATGAGFLQRRSAVERDIESVVIEEAPGEGDVGGQACSGLR